MAGTPQHLTLVANTVATVNFDKDFTEVEVVNVDGTGTVYFTVDAAAPTVAGTGAHVVTAGIGAFATAPSLGTTGDRKTVVRLISSGTPKVSVQAR